MIRSLLQKLRVPGFRNPRPMVAVLRLTGVIGQSGSALRPGLTIAGLVENFERAFAVKNLKAVALSVNSPGGAPAQSSLIQKRIRALAEEKEIPVFAFAEDVAASGGYWLACSADEIYADATSVIGSLGVISAGFGFPELLRRYGVERRVHASGENKSMLDPFLPEDPDDVARLLSLQADVHDAFKQMVRDRRGDRLKGDEAELFSGEFWTGTRAVDLGLIDGIGDLTSVMRDRFGERVRFRVISDRQGWLRRRLGISRPGPTPAVWATELIAVLEERALWGRFGL